MIVDLFSCTDGFPIGFRAYKNGEEICRPVCPPQCLYKRWHAKETHLVPTEPTYTYNPDWKSYYYSLKWIIQRIVSGSNLAPQIRSNMIYISANAYPQHFITFLYEILYHFPLYCRSRRKLKNLEKVWAQHIAFFQSKYEEEK